MTATTPEWERAVGIALALLSGLLIGASFIFKKKGLLESNSLVDRPGQGHSYLKNPKWWTGMIMMGVGEACNFGAYAFTPAILVTPLGAISVVISAVLASVFLKERLDFGGKVGCIQCVLGAIIVVFNAPESNTTSTIASFFSYVIQPFFLFYTCVMLGGVFYLIQYIAPIYGDKHPLVYISICSFVGSFLVLSMQGFGAAVVYSAANWDVEGGNQFKYWEMYPLLLFVIITAVMQINYLNKALNLFSTALITPVYYVFFTGSTITTSMVLFHGFKQIELVNGLSILIGFLVICGGVALLFKGFANTSEMIPLSNVNSSQNICDDVHTPSEVAGETKKLIQNNNNDLVLKSKQMCEDVELNNPSTTHVIIEMSEMGPSDFLNNNNNISTNNYRSNNNSNTHSKNNSNSVNYNNFNNLVIPKPSSNQQSNNNSNSNFQASGGVLNPLPKKVQNSSATKVKHSPTPSHDLTSTYSSKGIASSKPPPPPLLSGKSRSNEYIEDTLLELSPSVRMMSATRNKNGSAQPVGGGQPVGGQQQQHDSTQRQRRQISNADLGGDESSPTGLLSSDNLLGGDN